MAVYAPGQTIYISHPAKNHVAELPCTNQFIPDAGMELLMSTEVNVDTLDYSVPLVGGVHVDGQVDHLGYQRCYKFCDNMDKSHCLTGWTLPETITEGRHSFQWRWEFNAGQFYSNCFDAMITANAAPIVTIAAPNATIAAPNATIAAPNATIAPPDVTIAAPNVTIAPPDVTIAAPNATIAAPNVTIAPPDVTIAAPNATIAAPPDVTIAPPDVTIAPPTPTEDFNIQSQFPPSVSESPTATPSATAEVITSNASSLATPIFLILNISGILNITGFLMVDQ